MGRFIVFEGIDNSGKTLQLGLTADWLTATGIEVVKTREPGSTGLGTHLRKLLLDKTFEIDPLAETFLFMADRAENVNKIIKPALSQGKYVLCDRHELSTIAYQCFGKGYNPGTATLLNDIVTFGVKPDLIIWIDRDPQDLYDDSDKFESQGKPFINRVREGYRQLYESGLYPIIRVNGNNGIKDVQAEIRKAISEMK